MIASSFGILSYHLARLSVRLEKEGHDVTVISGAKEQVRGLAEGLVEASIEHFTSNHIDKRSIHDIYKTKKEIQGILKIKDIDVIHAQGVTHTLEAYLAIQSLRSDMRPQIITTVNSIPRGSLQKVEWAVMTSVLNTGSDIVLPVSNHTMRSLVRHGLNRRKAVTVHNALDLDVFDEAAQNARIDFEANYDRPAIVCVGNLIPVKGQEYYLMAASKVLDKHAADFYVVGNGPRGEYLRKLVRYLGIEKHVVFTGRIQWPMIYYFLSNTADICISSSISENFPFYILECMAARKPIVATNVGGVPEAVIDGVNGYLVPPRDPTSLSRAILRLINNPKKAKELGLKGRKLVEQRFSMDVITRKLKDVYELALKRK